MVAFTPWYISLSRINAMEQWDYRGENTLPLAIACCQGHPNRVWCHPGIACQEVTQWKWLYIIRMLVNCKRPNQNRAKTPKTQEAANSNRKMVRMIANVNPPLLPNSQNQTKPNQTTPTMITKERYPVSNAPTITITSNSFLHFSSSSENTFPCVNQTKLRTFFL